MKKIIILMVLFLVTLTTIASATNMYSLGTSFTNPAEIYFDENRTFFEYVTDSDTNSYYVVGRTCDGVLGLTGKYSRMCRYNATSDTILDCTLCNSPMINMTDTSYDDNGVTDRHLNLGAVSVSIGYVNVGSSTSGSITSTGITNPRNVFQNEYDYEYYYTNATHIKTNTGVYELPTIIQNNFSQVDMYKNNSFILLGGTNTRTIFHIDENASLIGTYNIESNEVVDTPLDIYGSGDILNIVTDGDIYQYYISDYFVFDSDYFSDVYCIDETKICNQTIFFDDGAGTLEFWCSDDDWSRCDGVCQTLIATDDDVNVSYEYGSCLATGCTNECDFNYQTECTGIDSTRTCGDYDSDPCLEWSPSTDCFPNQYCNAIGSCEEVNFTILGETYTQIDFYLNTQTTNNDYTTTTQDTEERYHVKTEYSAFTQKFNVQTSDPSTDIYTSKNCDYEETNHYSGNGYDLNITGTFTETFTSTTDNTNTEIIISLGDNETLSLVYGEASYNYAELLFIRNNTAKTLTVCRGDHISGCSNTLLTDTSTNSYDDLESITILTTLNQQTRSYDVYIGVTREDTTEYYQSIPHDYVDNSTSTYNRFSIYTTNNNSELISYEINRLPLLDSFKDTIKSDYDELLCTYAGQGCRTVRVYAQGTDIPLYNNYEDRVICIDTLGGVVGDNEVSGNNLLDRLLGLSLGVRIAIVLMLMIGVIVFIGTMKNDADNSDKQMFSIIQVLLPIGILIASAFIGNDTTTIIPSYIVLIMAILTAFIVAVFFKNQIFGGR